MKYILIETQEREISTPVFFNTHEEAFDEMCRQVAEARGAAVYDIKESYLSGEEFDWVTCIIENAAWTERYGNNFDWKIFKYNEEECECVS